MIERHRFISLLIKLQLSNPRFDEELARLGLREHEAIMGAILERDQARSLEALSNHLHTATETLLRLRR